MASLKSKYHFNINGRNCSSEQFAVKHLPHSVLSLHSIRANSDSLIIVNNCSIREVVTYDLTLKCKLSKFDN